MYKKHILNKNIRYFLAFMTNIVISLVAPVSHTYVTITTGSVFVSGMMGMPITLHDCFKSLMGPRGVLNNAMGTIRFCKFISSTDVVAISVFILRFLIVGMWIVYSVFKFVVNIVLYKLYLFFFLCFKISVLLTCPWWSAMVTPMTTEMRIKTYKYNKFLFHYFLLYTHN